MFYLSVSFERMILRELILVSDQLWLRPLFWISDVVANESFDGIRL